MVNMGSLDVSSLKNGFLSMLQQAKPGVLPEFMVWLERILAEYKMTGLYSTLPGYMLQPYLQYSPTTEALKSLISSSSNLISSPHMSPSHTQILSECHSIQPAKNDTAKQPLKNPISKTYDVKVSPILPVSSPILPKTQGSTLRSLLQTSTACVNLSEEFTDRAAISDTESRNGFDSMSRNEISQHPKKGGRSYECTKCLKSFTQHSSFKRHLKIHQGLYNYFCNMCEETFSRKEHLIHHKCPLISHPTVKNESLPLNTEKEKLETNEEKVFQPPEHEAPPPSPVELSSKWSDISSASSDPTSPNFHLQESRRKKSAPRKFVFGDYPQNEDYLSDIDESIYSGALKTESGALDFSMKKQSLKNISINKASLNEASLDLNGQKEELKNDEASKEFRISDLIGMAVTKYHSMVEPTAPDLVHKTPVKNEPSKTKNMSPKKRALLLEDYAEEFKVNNNVGSPKKQPNTVTEQTKIPVESIDSNFLATETGTYQITTEDVEADGAFLKEEGTPNKVIKVVKQGNYLKLKKEAQVIDGELRFICPHCNKVFHRSSNFSRHMRIHRGVFSYICSACNRGFYRKEHFDKHKCYRKAMATTWERKTRVEMDRKEWEKSSENGITDDEMPLSENEATQGPNEDKNESSEICPAGLMESCSDRVESPIVSQTPVLIAQH